MKPDVWLAVWQGGRCKILELHENTWFVLSEIAIDFASRARFGEALTFAEKAHALAPWDVVATGVLAGLLVRTGDRNRAEDDESAGGRRLTVSLYVNRLRRAAVEPGALTR